MFFEHAGIACSHMEKSVTFYRDLLQLTVRQYDERPEGTTVILDAENGCGVELVSNPNITGTPARALPKDEAGVRHIAFAVPDMNEIVSRLKAHGVEFTVEPRRPFVMKGANWVAFCKDPDGNIVEFIEKQSGTK